MATGLAIIGVAFPLLIINDGAVLSSYSFFIVALIFKYQLKERNN
ncbi:MAG: hypothetical protein PHE16_07070 [Aliarcobacter sp.]|nr:hypothetical protein [Aliarcobacter sp.]